MKLEEQIQEMFDKYPQLFPLRWDCLNHLFCTIGNGYDWVKGELIDEYMTSPKTGKYVKKRGEYLKFNGQLGDDGKATQRIIVDNPYKSDKLFLYPICKQYSYLLKYPKNIKSDWLLGIKETYEFIIENFPEDYGFEVCNSKMEKTGIRGSFDEVSKQELIDLYTKKFS